MDESLVVIVLLHCHVSTHVGNSSWQTKIIENTNSTIRVQ